MVAEVVAAFAVRPGRGNLASGVADGGAEEIIVDATLGLGGHAAALLDANPTRRLIGIDWDEASLAQAKARLRPYGHRITWLHGNFADLPALLDSLRVTAVHGLLADLGMSSYQLDDPQRGFSFQRAGPLDMRMDQRRHPTAAELLQRLSPQALAALLLRYGEERDATRIAFAICRAQGSERLATTTALAQLIERVVPRRGHRLHPATRTFQALRIAVNDELTQLGRFLQAGPPRLRPGGRLVCLTFHSLEDRLVKRAFHGWAEQGEEYRMAARKPLQPTRHEQQINPRARSARLRILERVSER